MAQVTSGGWTQAQVVSFAKAHGIEYHPVTGGGSLVTSGGWGPAQVLAFAKAHGIQVIPSSGLGGGTSNKPPTVVVPGEPTEAEKQAFLSYYQEHGGETPITITGPTTGYLVKGPEGIFESGGVEYLNQGGITYRNTQGGWQIVTPEEAKIESYKTSGGGYNLVGALSELTPTQLVSFGFRQEDVDKALEYRSGTMAPTKQIELAGGHPVNLFSLAGLSQAGQFGLPVIHADEYYGSKPGFTWLEKVRNALWGISPPGSWGGGYSPSPNMLQTKAWWKESPIQPMIFAGGLALGTGEAMGAPVLVKALGPVSSFLKWGRAPIEISPSLGRFAGPLSGFLTGVKATTTVLTIPTVATIGSATALGALSEPEPIESNIAKAWEQYKGSSQYSQGYKEYMSDASSLYDREAREAAAQGLELDIGKDEFLAQASLDYDPQVMASIRESVLGEMQYQPSIVGALGKGTERYLMPPLEKMQEWPTVPKFLVGGMYQILAPSTVASQLYPQYGAKSLTTLFPYFGPVTAAGVLTWKQPGIGHKIGTVGFTLLPGLQGSLFGPRAVGLRGIEKFWASKGIGAKVSPELVAEGLGVAKGKISYGEAITPLGGRIVPISETIGTVLRSDTRVTGFGAKLVKLSKGEKPRYTEEIKLPTAEELSGDIYRPSSELFPFKPVAAYRPQPVSLTESLGAPKEVAFTRYGEVLSPLEYKFLKSSYPIEGPTAYAQGTVSMWPVEEWYGKGGGPKSGPPIPEWWYPFERGPMPGLGGMTFGGGSTKGGGGLYRGPDVLYSGEFSYPLEGGGYGSPLYSWGGLGGELGVGTRTMDWTKTLPRLTIPARIGVTIPTRVKPGIKTPFSPIMPEKIPSKPFVIPGVAKPEHEPEIFTPVVTLPRIYTPLITGTVTVHPLMPESELLIPIVPEALTEEPVIPKPMVVPEPFPVVVGFTTTPPVISPPKIGITQPEPVLPSYGLPRLPLPFPPPLGFPGMGGGYSGGGIGKVLSGAKWVVPGLILNMPEPLSMRKKKIQLAGKKAVRYGAREVLRTPTVKGIKLGRQTSRRVKLVK